uniref:SLAIN motif family, member 1b n=1 Tax=Pygocentrus nattereri TaxID=42514 RepID=A0AAR2K3D9_PYGNA
MEAAVLKPRITADGSCGVVNAEIEVKKLQELVRKLERQNEQLRTRAHAVNTLASPRSLPSPPPPLSLFSSGGFCSGPGFSIHSALPPCCAPEEPFPYFQPHSAADTAEEAEQDTGLASEPTVLDEVDLLDLDSIFQFSQESDETWLYSSSMSCLWSGGDPLQWCRHVLDHPQPEAEATRRSLCQRLESGRSLRRGPFSPQSSLDSELSASELEDDSIALGYKLQDLTDVQVMARLQEESLRQDYATTSASACVNSRRSASFSFQFGQRGECNLEEEDDEDEDYGQLPPPQPRLTRTGPLQRGLPHSHTFTSIRDWRMSAPSTPSTPSTPTSLPFQIPASLSTPVFTPEQPSLRASSDKLRRSMPNLVRAPSMPSVPSPANHTGSPTSIRNSQSFDSSSGLARLQSSIPSPGQLQNRVQSVGNFPLSSRQPLKATAYVSPTIKGPSNVTTSASSQPLPSSSIPLPSKGGSTQTPGRSGLPRPASFIGTSSTPRSKLAQPVRSLLTPPKSLATLSALRDANWRDGCY